MTRLFRLLAPALLAPALLAPDLLAAEPQWFRGNTHAHSLWSDGNDFPENIIHWYHTNGYQFAVLSDHNVLAEGERWISAGKAARSSARAEKLFGADWVVRRTEGTREEVRLRRIDEYRERFEAPGRFLIVPAEEISASYQDAARGKRLPVHLNAVNPGERILPINTGATVRDVLRRNLRSVANQEEKLGRPILAHLNHPNFHYALTGEDLGHVVEERFFEVYNGHPGINHLGKEGSPGDEEIWDIANAIRIGELKAPPLFGMATDDSHTYHGGKVSPGRGWVMVRADELSAAALIRAMRAGDFYASSGVTLSSVGYDPAARRIAIEVDGEAACTAQLIGTRKGGKPGEVFETKTGANLQFDLPADALYGRVTLTSSLPHPNPSFAGQKQQAWTQPVGW